MSIIISKRSMMLFTAVGVLGLTACTSHYHGSRYGGDPCQINCLPMPMPQPVYYVQPQPQPRPLPLPPPTTTTLRPTPEPTPAPKAVTCPAGWMMGPSGVCLEIVAPTYVPPPTTGYPDVPKKKRRTYKPKRK